MAEIAEPAHRGDAFDTHRPSVGRRAVEAPSPVLGLGVGFAHEDAVGAAPFVRRKPGRPHGLRLRAIDAQRAEALELAAAPGIQELVVLETLVTERRMRLAGGSSRALMLCG